MPKFEDILKERQPKKIWPAILSFIAGVLAIFTAWNAPIVISMLTFKVVMPWELANFDVEIRFILLILILGFGAGFLALLCYRSLIQKLPPITLFTGAKKFRFKLLTLGIILSSLFVLGGMIFFEPEYIATIKRRFSQLGPYYFVILCAAYLLAFVVQSTFEELYFRGFLTQYLRRILIPNPIVIFITSLLFALVHYSPSIPMSVLASAFLMGLAFAIASWRTNGLEIAIGAHIANNFIVGALVGALDNRQANDEAYLSAVLFLAFYLGALELALRLWPKFFEGAKGEVSGS